MLERKPGLDQDGVRKALISTAARSRSAGLDTQFGAGLVDAYRAVMSLEPRHATTGVGSACSIQS